VKFLLNVKKEEIIQHIGAEGLKKLKFTKLLKLITFEIEELIEYWTIRQVHQMVNEIFNINVSKALFYGFCEKNIKKKKDFEVMENRKIDKGVSLNRDTMSDEKSINNIDDLTDLTLDFLSKNLPKK
jgi:hypothetical protein